ncbi:carboxypeptidase-like regulatory domain-containing protein [Flavobacterium sp. NRK1]|uniref:carboxypeptidase-like regulatory domain-containing protein n=1 Tax=Flavobacterium sp. NRK1 TaxID=2954929 RepID=UPI002092E6EF|nr:carboxypeptidase-like regulatory domain-containing protein [Flavobacterium sp. NRK1]MCO6148832.1 carboxypeptidase-like regulatory domain-containing protein [Flavobacterium sp. NRK1]
MRYFVVFLFALLSLNSFAQGTNTNPEKVSGIILNEATLQPVAGVSIININRVKGTVTDSRGNFTIEAVANDTLHVSLVGYQPIKVRVSSDWIKFKNVTKINLTEKAYTLEEVIISKYNLTGYLQIDSKLAPVRENYRYSISGLPQGYESGENSPNAFKKIISSMFNPADLLHNIFGKKPAEMRRLKEMKKDDSVRNALAEKYDRETLAALLGVSKDDIADILERCNYSEDFIKNSNDLQIMDAISGCYEEYKALNRK